MNPQNFSGIRSGVEGINRLSLGGILKVEQLIYWVTQEYCCAAK